MSLPERGSERCVYCEEPMEPRKDGLRAHEVCSERYGSSSPPDDFMLGEDGYVRFMAWRAGQ